MGNMSVCVCVCAEFPIQNTNMYIAHQQAHHSSRD